MYSKLALLLSTVTAVLVVSGNALQLQKTTLTAGQASSVVQQQQSECVQRMFPDVCLPSRVAKD
jgi:hypothetical protein